MVCKISVIVPCFNVETYITECLESVLQQAFDDMEILCVDDGSTDGTRRILEQYARRDERIRMISYGKNGGLSYARNRAMEQSHGTYLCFLDADDMLAPGALTALYAAAEAENLDAVRMDVENFYEDAQLEEQFPSVGMHHGTYDGTYTGQAFFAELVRKNDYSPAVWFFLWKRAFLQGHGIRFHEGILHEDISFTFAGLAFAERVQMQPAAKYLYRRRASSISMTTFTSRNILGHVAGFADVIMTLGRVRPVCPSYLPAVNAYISQRFRDCHEMIRLAMKDHLCGLTFENGLQEFVYFRMLFWGTMPAYGLPSLRTMEVLWRKDEIIIYGAGKVGWNVLRELEALGVQNYHLAVTKKSPTQTGGLMGMARELREYRELRGQSLVIVASGEKLHEEMEAEAHRQGFRDVVWQKELFKEDPWR